MKNLTKNDTVLISCGTMNCLCQPFSVSTEKNLRSECGSFCCAAKYSESYSFSVKINERGDYYTETETCAEFRDFLRAVGLWYSL